MGSARKPAPRRPDRTQRRIPETRASRRVPDGVVAALPAEERKERVLHTRVPESLDRQLRRRARNLGMSVSTVVRHVLLNTFGLVEDIVVDSTNVALSIAGAEADGAHDAPAPAADLRARALRGSGEPDAGADVLAWHEAILNRNAVCDHCNAVLVKGARAAVGLAERRGARAVLCVECLRELTATRPNGDAQPRPRIQRGRARARNVRRREREE